MRRAQSACGGLLPAPAEQTECAEASGKERERGRYKFRLVGNPARGMIVLFDL
jgi:hypothetical protein